MRDQIESWIERMKREEEGVVRSRPGPDLWALLLAAALVVTAIGLGMAVIDDVPGLGPPTVVEVVGLLMALCAFGLKSRDDARDRG